MQDLRGRVAVVTGGAGGIGRELGPEGLEEYCEIQTIVLAT